MSGQRIVYTTMDDVEQCVRDCEVKPFTMIPVELTEWWVVCNVSCPFCHHEIRITVEPSIFVPWQNCTRCGATFGNHGLCYRLNTVKRHQRIAAEELEKYREQETEDA